MSRLARPAALLLGTALTFSAVAAPRTAFGDDTTGTTTDVTAADVVTALEAAQPATAAADQGGWRANGLIVNPDKSTSSLTLVYAPQEGRDLIAANNPPFKIIDVDHTGTYESVPSYATSVGGPRRLKRALAMLGHPTATWILSRDTSVSTQDPGQGTIRMGPQRGLSLLVNPKVTTFTGTPTQTIAADGSTTYVLPVKLTDGSADKETITLTLDAAGVLSESDTEFSDGQMTRAFSYGPQHIDLPAASETVHNARVDQALRLLTLTRDTRILAHQAGRVNLVLPGKHAPAVKALRANATMLETILNRQYGAKVFTSRNIVNGVRVTGTNTITHEKLTYTVKVRSGKLVVRHG